MNYSPEDMDEFVKLVREMRAKQKEFFANRSQNSMITAKAAEQQVDGWLNHFAEMRQIAKMSVQQEKLL